jgi:hypothetical protein
MQHPDLIIMIHEQKVAEESRKAALPRTRTQLGPVSTVRAVTGNALIALGTRIAPRQRPLTSTITIPVSARAAT